VCADAPGTSWSRRALACIGRNSTDYAFASGLLERIAGKSTRRFCPVEHSGLLTALVLAGRASTPKTYAGNGCSAAATNFETSSLIHNA
jgi:hypothetical protein